MGRKNGEFGFGHVEPASVFGRVMPFEAVDEAPRLRGGEGGIERGLRVRGEVVLHQHDLSRGWKMRVGQFLENVGVVAAA